MSKKLYLVSEGDVYTREDAPDHLRGYNFGDWAIFEAEDEDDAMRMALALDGAVNSRSASAAIRGKFAALKAASLREENIERTAFEWLDAYPSLRFTTYGFGG